MMQPKEKQKYVGGSRKKKVETGSRNYGVEIWSKDRVNRIDEPFFSLAFFAFSFFFLVCVCKSVREKRKEEKKWRKRDPKILFYQMTDERLRKLDG